MRLPHPTYSLTSTAYIHESQVTGIVNTALKTLKHKIQGLVQDGTNLIKELEEFGWKDERPEYIEEVEFAEAMHEQNLSMIKAKKRIPPQVSLDYHRWYAQCLAIVEANMPSRMDELTKIHQPAKSVFTDTSMLGLINRGYMTLAEQQTVVSNIIHMQSIVGSVPSYVEGRLLDMELLVAQSYVKDELVEATILFDAGYVRAAGAVAGMLLERHLKRICDKQPALVYKHGTIGALNKLLNDKQVYDKVQWTRVDWMREIRNTCDHANTAEPAKQDVEDLIKEVGKFVELFAV